MSTKMFYKGLKLELFYEFSLFLRYGYNVVILF